MYKSYSTEVMASGQQQQEVTISVEEEATLRHGGDVTDPPEVIQLSPFDVNARGRPVSMLWFYKYGLLLSLKSSIKCIFFLT